jgi:adenylylsulfate kinase-like enzyme
LDNRSFWFRKDNFGKKIHKDITKKYRPTLMISGDNIRKIFKLKGYENKEKLEIAKKYSQFAKYIKDQKINIIIAVVAMYDEPRKWNTLNIDNYIEIYIRSNIKDIIKLNKKKFIKKNPGKLIGIDIKQQYPKNPTIILTNLFKTDFSKISKILMNKINNIVYETR